MKRVWFAVIFLGITAMLCVKEQCYIRDFNAEFDEKITAAEECIKRSDSDGLNECIEDIQSYWADNNDLLFIICNHDTPDELGLRIRALSTESDIIGDALYDIKALNAVLYEDQRITFSNIL